MTSRKSLVTTVTVTMTTTTTPPLLEMDNGNDPQGSSKETSHAQTAFQRHFVYEPQPLNPKWPLEMRIQDGEPGSLRWLARSKDGEHDGQEPSRWPSDKNQYNQDNYSNWQPGGHIPSNNNSIGFSRMSSSGNSSMNFVNNIGGNTNCNYYNTSYIKDSGPLLRDQFVDRHYLESLSPPPPSSPLLMMVREKMEGEETKELGDVSAKELRGPKYPPPRRDSDGHILGSANYSAPSPPERDLTLPYPLSSSETIAWKKEKKLSPLPCEPLKDANVWKEAYDVDPYSNKSYMPTNPTFTSTATNTHISRENADEIIEKHSLPTSGYVSKEVSESVSNERASKTLFNHAPNRLYIVKPKPFYNTSTQTDDMDVGYDSQLQFSVEDNSRISPRVSSMQPNFGPKSDHNSLEKATQVQLTKTSFVDSGLVTLEQLRSPNHQEFIPASAPLLRRLTEEYYQMNINEDTNENNNYPQQPNIDIDEHVMDINKFDLHIKKTSTNDTGQEHQQPYMNINQVDLNIKTKTNVKEPLEHCMDKIHDSSIDEPVMTVNEQMQTYINVKKDIPNINNFNETDTNTYEYEENVNECHSKPCVLNKKKSVHVNRPQPQFCMDVKFEDATIYDQGLSVDETKLPPFVGIRKNTTEKSLNISKPQPQSHRDVPIDKQYFSASITQPKISKGKKVSFTMKENLLRLFRGGTNNTEPDYMNVSEQIGDYNIHRRSDSVDDVFEEVKGLPKQIRGDPRIGNLKPGVTPGPSGVATGVMAEIPEPYKFKPIRVNSENLKSRTESAPEKLTQITEGKSVSSEIRHASVPDNVFRKKEKDYPQIMNQEGNSRSLKERYRLNHDNFLNQTKENVSNQPTEIDSRHGKKYENQFILTRGTNSPNFLKKYGSTSDILFGQTTGKNHPINSRNSGRRSESWLNQVRENIFIQKNVSESSENRYFSSTEKPGNQKLSTNVSGAYPGLISNYPQTQFGSVSDILNTPYIAHPETQAVKPDSLTETSKITAETEKSAKYPKKVLNTTRYPSVEQTFDKYDDTSKGFENQSMIQHGRSESLPVDSTNESPVLQLRSYYSCTDVNKGKPTETTCTYGVSDYMDMSGHHRKECSLISSRETEDFKASSDFVPTNKKKRSSSCTSYRIHANTEPEEDPPPQLPPRAYRNMPENPSGNMNWIYESLRHRRSYANELRKQARRLNIYKPMANISESHVTDISESRVTDNEVFVDKDPGEVTNIYAVEKDKEKERKKEKERSKEKQKLPNGNSVKDEAAKTLNNKDDSTNVTKVDNEDIKTDLHIIDTDIDNSTSIDEVNVKSHEVKEDIINSEHSTNNECSPAIIKPVSNNDIFSSNFSQHPHIINEQYLNLNEQNQSQTIVSKKPTNIDDITYTSEEYRHSAAHIHTIKDSFKPGIIFKETDIDSINEPLDNITQSEHNLNDSFEPNLHINEQESHLISEDFNMNNKMYLNENSNITNNDINVSTGTDENVNSENCVLRIDENSADINEENRPVRKNIVQVSSLSDLSKARPLRSIQSQNVTPPFQTELHIPSPPHEHYVLKMPSPESSSNKVQFRYRSSSEQCLTSIGSCDDQMKLPLYVSLVNIPAEEGFLSKADQQRELVSVKQRIHFFEYDSNGHLVGNRIPPPVPAKPTSLVLRKKVPKEEGFSPTQPSPERDLPVGKSLDLSIEQLPESSVDILDPDEEESKDEINRMEPVQYNIQEYMDLAADKPSLLLPEVEEVTSNLEYFQQPEPPKEDPIDAEHLVRKKNALRDSLRNKLDVLREAKMNVEAEIQEVDNMKKNICSRFENVCPNNNERRKLIDFFKDREMCQVLLSKLKVRLTRLEKEMEESRPNPDLNDKLSKLRTQYEEAEQLSSDIDARQNSLVRLLEKYLTEANLSDFNYLLMMRPRLVSEMFEINEKIFTGGQKLLELERVPYK